MSLAEKIALNIGKSARQVLQADEEKEQVIVYGAINLLQTFFSIVWVIIFGLLFGAIYEALLFSIVAAMLRKYSGGVHASLPQICIAIGTVTATLSGILISNILYKLDANVLIVASILCILASLVIVYKNAPVDSVKKPITDSNIRKRFKAYSVKLILFLLLAIIFLYLLNIFMPSIYNIKAIECILLGVLWQCFTLTKLGFNILSKVDFVLKYIMKGGNLDEK